MPAGRDGRREERGVGAIDCPCQLHVEGFKVRVTQVSQSRMPAKRPTELSWRVVMIASCMLIWRRGRVDVVSFVHAARAKANWICCLSKLGIGLVAGPGSTFSASPRYDKPSQIFSTIV